MDYPWAHLMEVPCGVMAESPKVQTSPLPGSSSLPVLCQGSQSVARGHPGFVGEGTVVKPSPLWAGWSEARELAHSPAQGLRVIPAGAYLRGGWVGGLPRAPVMLSRRASGLKVLDVLWLHGGIMACVEGGQEAQLSVAGKGDH